VAGVASAAWIAAAADAQTPKRGGNLTLGTELEPPHYDCHAGPGVNVIAFVAPEYSMLMRYDVDAFPKIVGDLAESWSASPDGLTYTVKLRPNVKFHDGSTLTAEDVKASYDRIRNPPTGIVSVRKNDYVDVASIDVVDPLTVAFKLSQRNTMMLDYFASPFNCIYSARRLQQEPNYPATNVMGTGAYTFVEYVKGQSWTGKRFDSYFKPGQPYLDGFKWVLFAPGAPINALSAGQIDAFTRGLAPQEVETIRNVRGDKVKFPTAPLLQITHVTFNTTRKPFDDPRVRKALNLAIDRYGGLEPMSKINNSFQVGKLFRNETDLGLPAAELEKLPGYGRDMNANRAEARRLLTEAGVPNLTFKLHNSNQANPFGSLGLFVIDQWRQIGVTVEQAPVDFGNYLRLHGASDFDVSIDYAAVAADDPTASLVKFIPGSGTNYGKINDPVLADLYAKQKVEGDPAARKKLVNSFEQRVIEQAYIAPLFRPGWVMVMSSDVMGWKPSPNYYYGYDLTDVWRQ
jgi:peptide/nickel transport system substrate-binding protein